MQPRIVLSLVLTLICFFLAVPQVVGAEGDSFIQYVPGGDSLFAQTNQAPQSLDATNITQTNIVQTNVTEQWQALIQQTAAFSNALTILQDTFTKQKQRELDLGKESNALNERILELGKQSHAMNLTLIIGAAVLVTALILSSFWFQLRCFNRVMELSRSVALVQSRAPAYLEDHGASNSRLLEAIKLLEHRIEHLGLGESGKAALNAANPGILAGSPPELVVPSTGSGSDSAKHAPANITQLLEKGQIALDADSLSEAAHCFSDALALDPLNAEAHLKKGIALERMNRLEPALSCYEEVLRLNPQRTIASVYKSRVLAALHRYDEAMSVYESVPSKLKGDSTLTLEWLEASGGKG